MSRWLAYRAVAVEGVFFAAFLLALQWGYLPAEDAGLAAFWTFGLFTFGCLLVAMYRTPRPAPRGVSNRACVTSCLTWTADSSSSPPR
jgi:hypothetical protein